MSKQIRVSPDITVGGQPSAEELEDLKHRGYRGVINLRHAGEDEEQLAPDMEGHKVNELGMQYAHIPVSMSEMSARDVECFKETLATMPKPVYVHCHTGKRSGALSMLHLGVESRLSGEEVLDRAEEMGFECEDERLASFVKRYMDEHAPGP